jgi:hypothetical protein
LNSSQSRVERIYPIVELQDSGLLKSLSDKVPAKTLALARIELDKVGIVMRSSFDKMTVKSIVNAVIAQKAGWRLASDVSDDITEIIVARAAIERVLPQLENCAVDFVPDLKLRLLNDIERHQNEAVTMNQGQTVRDNMCNLNKEDVMKMKDIDVIISYATGMRKDINDGKGCGLGMLYCQLICTELNKRGISTFSGLHIPSGNNWMVYFDVLPRCKIMVVIQTPAYYKSWACMKEITAGLDNKLVIIPLIFELESQPGKGDAPRLPEAETMWVKELAKMEEKNEVEAKEHLVETIDDFSKRNSEPAPPLTVLDRLEVLENVAKRVLKLTGSTLSSKSSRSSAPDKSEVSGQRKPTKFTITLVLASNTDLAHTVECDDDVTVSFLWSEAIRHFGDDAGISGTCQSRK